MKTVRYIDIKLTDRLVLPAVYDMASLELQLQLQTTLVTFPKRTKYLFYVPAASSPSFQQSVSKV